MGSSIASISGGLARPGPPPTLVGRRNTVREPIRLPGQREAEGTRGPFFRRDSAPTFTAGFGGNSISGPGAALHTINSTVRNARELIPSLEEIRARFRLRASANVETREPALATRPSQDDGLRRITVQIPDASTQARNFINTLNDAAGAAQALLQGEGPPGDTNRAIARFGEQTISFLNRPESSFRFDVTV